MIRYLIETLSETCSMGVGGELAWLRQSEEIKRGSQIWLAQRVVVHE